MNMKKTAIVATTLFLLLGSFLAAEAGKPATIPKFILMETDQVNVGQEASFNHSSLQVKHAAASACADCYYLAFSAVTGAAGRVTFVTFENSWAEIQKAMADFQRIHKEALRRAANFASKMGQAQSGRRFVIAQFSPGMSLNPDKIDAAQITMWRVTSFQLKPAMNTPFAELTRETADLHKKANDNAQWLAYTIVAGEPGPKVIFLRPLQNLAELDQPESPEFIALMTPDMRKHFNEVMAQTEAANETNLYIADPALSRPPQEYLSANPGFWVVKEPASAQTGKKAKKAAQPGQ